MFYDTADDPAYEEFVKAAQALFSGNTARLDARNKLRAAVQTNPFMRPVQQGEINQAPRAKVASLAGLEASMRAGYGGAKRAFDDYANALDAPMESRWTALKDFRIRRLNPVDKLMRNSSAADGAYGSTLRKLHEANQASGAVEKAKTVRDLVRGVKEAPVKGSLAIARTHVMGGQTAAEALGSMTNNMLLRREAKEATGWKDTAKKYALPAAGVGAGVGAVALYRSKKRKEQEAQMLADLQGING